MNTRIEQDLDPPNPRTEFDQLGVMCCFHTRYVLGDKHEYRSGDYSGWDELEEAIRKEEDPVVVLQLYLYDHGDLAISTSPFSCPWDSGRAGFIFARRGDVLKEYGRKRISKKVREQVEKVLRQEVEIYNQYLAGDIWGFVIEDDDGEHLDSCWGFFGHEYCEQEAKEAAKHCVEGPNEVAKRCET